MGRYLVKINELSEKNKYLYEIICKIENDITTLSSLKDNIHWESPSRNKFTIKYDEYITTLNKMLDNLVSCLKITEKYEANYTNGYQKIKKEFKKVEEDLPKIKPIEIESLDENNKENNANLDELEEIDG